MDEKGGSCVSPDFVLFGSSICPIIVCSRRPSAFLASAMAPKKIAAKKDAAASKKPVAVSAAKSAKVALDLAKQFAAEEAKEKDRLACVCV